MDRANGINLPENLQTLSIDDRLEIIERIWVSIAKSPDEMPLTASQCEELDRRKAEHERDPDAAKPWTEIKTRLEGRHS